MASCITSQSGNSYCPQFRLTVTEKTSDETSSTLSWKLEYVAHGYATSTTKMEYTVTIDGKNVKSSTYNSANITNTKTVSSGSVSVNKSTSKKNVTFKISVDMNLTWHGVYIKSKSSSGSITIGAKKSYKVTYNANGGTGAPASQTKWHGSSLKLSSTVPSRSGYTFNGWSTGQDNTPEYQPGDTYSSNSNVTLYAIWIAHKYSVAYNSNGFSDVSVPGVQTKVHDVDLTLSSYTPTKKYYEFKGWGTSSSSTTVAYQPGSIYTKNANLNLFAIWDLVYIQPVINNVVIERCDASGVLDESGLYCLVEFDWKTYEDATISTISYADVVTGEWPTSNTFQLYGRNGHVRETIGGSLNVEHSFEITIEIADQAGSNTLTFVLPSIDYTIDFLTEGKGISFGRPATVEGFHSYMPSFFHEPVCTSKGSFVHVSSEPASESMQGYIKFLIIKPNMTWIEDSIIINLTSSYSPDLIRLIIKFEGVESLKPQMSYFQVDKSTDTYNDFYAVNELDGSWVIYASTWGWNRISVLDLKTSEPNLKGIDFEWTDEYVISLSPGSKKATIYNDTGWVTCNLKAGYKTYNNEQLQVRRIGNIVQMIGVISTTKNTNWSSDDTVVAMLPDERFYPVESDIKSIQQGSGSNRFLLRINTNGNVIMGRYSNNETTNNTVSQNAWLNCFASWFI